MSGVKNGNSRLVYSSEQGRICPACGQPLRGCRCRQAKEQANRDGVVRVGRETKGRKGSGVTVVSGVPLDAAGVKQLAQALKRLCGTGGTVKGGVIEIQGEHRDRLVAELQRRGFTVKKAGG